MPRLATSLLRQARKIDPLLMHLLKPCRDLRSARLELKWLQEHVSKLSAQKGLPQLPSGLLRTLCKERGRGQPLQYILGTDYFGLLEIVCRPGVLIPRPESADIATALADRLLHNAFFDKPESLPPHIRILDVCTGTGCMLLLLSYMLTRAPIEEGVSYNPSTRGLGVDISRAAVRLARENYLRLVADSELSDKSAMINFAHADVFPSYNEKIASLAALLITGEETQWDIVISNPPYISPSRFWSSQTSRSVRCFEPQNALVPPNVQGNDGDIFYPRILQSAAAVGAKVAMLEVGDMEQAVCVARMATQMDHWQGVEIWRDGTGVDEFFRHAPTASDVGERNVKVYGSEENEGRAVVCWRDEGAGWMSLK